MSIIMIAASMLSVSPLNVRKTSDPDADRELRASIVARGLLENLIALPVPRKKGRYEVIAGGRRLSQVHAAIEAGDLPFDFEVAVLVLTDRAEATETSLAENFHKLNMHPADECMAFRHMIEAEGKQPSDIAKRIGKTERFVLGRLRLANLADIVFTALKDNQITLDVAMAYAATTDTEQQTRVFGSYPANTHPNTIRRAVLEAGYSGASDAVRLISRADYEAAGGRVVGDLFTDAAHETWLDRAIVDQLGREKLQAVADEVAATHGYTSVRIVETHHAVYAAARGLDVLQGEIPAPTDEQIARLAEIEPVIAALATRAEEDDGANLSEDEKVKLDGLQAEHQTLTNPLPILTPEQKSRAIAFVFPDGGQVYLHQDVYAEPLPKESAKAGEASEIASTPTLDTATVAPTSSPMPAPAPAPTIAAETVTPQGPVQSEPEEKSGLTQRLAIELAIQKTELIAVHVANDPHFALDLGVFIMADRALAEQNFGGAGPDLPSELRASVPQTGAADFRSASQAAAAWDQLTDALDRSWHDLATPEARFDAFRCLDDDAKAAWLGWTVARTLRPVETGKPGSSFVDHLGSSLDINVAAWWRPTAENYFDRISKTMTLAAIEEVGGAELRNRYGASKKTDLAASAEKLFRGETIVEAEIRPALLAWVPPAMALGAPVVGSTTGQDPAQVDFSPDADLDTAAIEPDVVAA
ncbi:ParB/RepB/Spo0J family partition protein [Sphingomonas sp. TZW2008]|uniref:ParB/RepB/Spo0J family partition protein n=1 Tax=Sphingomonas sp. TZW2008 TaxID=1917973 RepID=UPI000A26A077|nr:ParB/RepB/Spo0J family partition protein [Sphingomonas sp. TZW2008]